MLRRIQLALVIGLAWLSGPLAFAANWSADVSQRMGLMTPPGVVVEVRVWVGNGILRPFLLYRIWQTTGGVSGEKIAWDQRVHSSDPETEGIVRKDDRKAESQLRHSWCGNRLKKNGDVLWCTVETIPTLDWSLIFQDLRPDKLRALRDPESLGSRPCTTEDGVGVTIEVIDQSNATYFSISNPAICCPWDECATASQILAVVDRIR